MLSQGLKARRREGNYGESMLLIGFEEIPVNVGTPWWIIKHPRGEVGIDQSWRNC